MKIISFPDIKWTRWLFFFLLVFICQSFFGTGSRFTHFQRAYSLLPHYYPYRHTHFINKLINLYWLRMARWNFGQRQTVKMNDLISVIVIFIIVIAFDFPQNNFHDELIQTIYISHGIGVNGCCERILKCTHA